MEARLDCAGSARPRATAESIFIRMCGPETGEAAIPDLLAIARAALIGEAKHLSGGCPVIGLMPLGDLFEDH
jgi:hypothetical protein